MQVYCQLLPIKVMKILRILDQSFSVIFHRDNFAFENLTSILFPVLSDFEGITLILMVVYYGYLS